MHLVQIFLPLQDNRGRRVARRHFEQLAKELSARFGGLTAYARAPATGLWKSRGSRPQRDDIVIYEVMTARLEQRWWQRERAALEQRFGQEQLLIRAFSIRRI